MSQIRGLGEGVKLLEFTQSKKIRSQQTLLNPHYPGETSLVVQWLRLHAPNSEDPSLLPGQRIRYWMLQLKAGTAKLVIFFFNLMGLILGPGQWGVTTPSCILLLPLVIFNHTWRPSSKKDSPKADIKGKNVRAPVPSPKEPELSTACLHTLCSISCCLWTLLWPQAKL